MNINSPGNYESSGELSFSTMAQLYAPPNFNSRLGVGADDFNSEMVDIIESVNPVFECAKGTGRKFRGGKLVKQKGCSTVAKSFEMNYVRHIVYDSIGNIAEETYSDDYGFGIQAKTLKELKMKMAEHGKDITESAVNNDWRAAIGAVIAPPS